MQDLFTRVNFAYQVAYISVGFFSLTWCCAFKCFDFLLYWLFLFFVMNMGCCNQQPIYFLHCGVRIFAVVSNNHISKETAILNLMDSPSGASCLPHCSKMGPLTHFPGHLLAAISQAIKHLASWQMQRKEGPRTCSPNGCSWVKWWSHWSCWEFLPLASVESGFYLCCSES